MPRIQVQLPDLVLADLDARRGSVPRSAYIRDLVTHHLDGEEPDDIQVQTFDGRIVRRIPSPRPASGDPVRPNHEHTWVRAGNIFDRCECGETRRR